MGEILGKFAMINSDEWVLVGVTHTVYGAGVYYLSDARQSDNMPLEAITRDREG